MTGMGRTEASRSDPRYDALRKKMGEWVWERCPGCGRRSKHHPEGGPSGEYHSDGCPLEGLYGHTHPWWFEREIERLDERAEKAEKQAAQAIAEINRLTGAVPHD